MQRRPAHRRRHRHLTVPWCIGTTCLHESFTECSPGQQTPRGNPDQYGPSAPKPRNGPAMPSISPLTARWIFLLMIYTNACPGRTQRQAPHGYPHPGSNPRLPPLPVSICRAFPPRDMNRTVSPVTPNETYRNISRSLIRRYCGETCLSDRHCSVADGPKAQNEYSC